SKLQACLIAAQDRKSVVRVEHAPGFAHSPAVHEIDRLRKLDDAVIGKVADDALAELLMVTPKIAEVSAAVQENRAVFEPVRQPCPRVILQAADVHDVHAIARQPIAFTKPDGAVADVAVIGKVEQRTPRTRRDQRGEYAID